jgi:hypothetical protein
MFYFTSCFFSFSYRFFVFIAALVQQTKLVVVQ